MFVTAAMFSLMMILLSIYIGLGQRAFFLEAIIMILTIMFFMIEFLQLSALKQEYLKNLWNWVDFLGLSLIIVFMCTRFADNQSLATQNWMTSAIIILGYLRWISYLRLFAPTRHLIEIILVVLYDMLGFMAIIASILIGFSLIFLQFSRSQDQSSSEYSTHFYNTYQLMFGNYDDSQYSLSQIVLTSSLLLILNVVLLNLLISIIGDSYGKVQERKELVDALSRLDMIKDAMILIRKFRRRTEQKKGYLIYCLPATIEDETQEKIEWKSRMDEIKSLFTQNEMQVIKKVEQEISQFRDKFDNIENMEDRMKETIDKIEDRLKNKIEKMESKIEEEISQVRTEVKTLSQLVVEKLSEITQTLKETSLKS